jgi:hypothetical protein
VFPNDLSDARVEGSGTKVTKPVAVPGSYVWSWTGDSVRLNAVPEPSTYAIALAGLACGGSVVFRRRKRV